MNSRVCLSCRERGREGRGRDGEMGKITDRIIFGMAMVLSIIQYIMKIQVSLSVSG